MRKLLILSAITLAIIAPPFEAIVQAEAPPTFIGAGALFRNGGSTEFAVQASFNVNIMHGEKDSVGVSTSQVYGSGRFFYADDVGLDSAVTQQLEAISGYVIGEITYGDWFVAAGAGILTETQEGPNPYAPALLLEGGWRPIELIRITVGSQYIPINNMGDLVFVYGGFGLQF